MSYDVQVLVDSARGIWQTTGQFLELKPAVRNAMQLIELMWQLKTVLAMFGIKPPHVVSVVDASTGRSVVAYRRAEPESTMRL